jgi:hypothetical protein
MSLMPTNGTRMPQEDPVTCDEDRLPQGAIHGYIHVGTRCAEAGRW